jgi:hypothetical protein
MLFVCGLMQLTRRADSHHCRRRLFHTRYHIPRYSQVPPAVPKHSSLETRNRQATVTVLVEELWQETAAQ